jgi:phospholipid-binding lipoprotein MlaA
MTRRSSLLLLLALTVACARGPSPETSGADSPAPAASTSSERGEAESTAGDAATSPSVSTESGDDDLADLMAEYESDTETPEKEIADPIKPWNVVWFYFNDKLHFWVMKPVSTGWRYLLYPRPVRLGIRNVIVNLGFPGRFFNTLLQGRPVDSGTEVARFVVNSTVGVAGLWDPATKWCGWEIYEEDFDQTLGVWGWEMEIYITWPIFGPSSIRGTMGSVVDNFLDPIRNYSIVALVNRINNMSLEPDNYATIVRGSVDPYVAVRNGYVQNRQKEVKEKDGEEEETEMPGL